MTFIAHIPWRSLPWFIGAASLICANVLGCAMALRLLWGAFHPRQPATNAPQEPAVCYQ